MNGRKKTGVCDLPFWRRMNRRAYFDGSGCQAVVRRQVSISYQLLRPLAAYVGADRDPTAAQARGVRVLAFDRRDYPSLPSVEVKLKFSVDTSFRFLYSLCPRVCVGSKLATVDLLFLTCLWIHLLTCTDVWTRFYLRNKTLLVRSPCGARSPLIQDKGRDQSGGFADQGGNAGRRATLQAGRTARPGA